VFRLFLDDQTEEIVLSPGRKLAVRRQGEWLQAGNSPTTREEWAAFWTVFCRAAHIDPRQSGYVSVLLQERVVAEAILPPLSWQPLFMARKRPAARGLGELVSGGQLTTEQATTLREATAAGRGILVSGPPDSGRTTLLEAVVDAIPRLARIALVERRTQLRTVSPLVARLRDRAASAVTTALTVSPDWIVVDDGLAETLRQAVLAGVPTIVAVRGDAEQWRDRAARLLGDDGRAQIDDAFAVTVRLETTDGGFRCVEVT